MPTLAIFAAKRCFTARTVGDAGPYREFVIITTGRAGGMHSPLRAFYLPSL